MKMTTLADGTKVSGAGALKVCPSCNSALPLDEFGFRRMTDTGEIRPQSHCRRCRSKVKP